MVEHLNGPIRLSVRFEKNKTWVFSIKKFEPDVDQFILTEMSTWVTEKSNFFTGKNFFVSYKCEIFENNYDIWKQHKRTNWRCNLHQWNLQQGEMWSRERTSIQSENHLRMYKVQSKNTCSIFFSRNTSPRSTVTRTKNGWNESKVGLNVSISYWMMIWETYSLF